MKIRVTSINKVLANLRPDIKVGDEFEVIDKSDSSENKLNNPCYLIYDKTGAAISLYHNEVEEIEEIEEIKKQINSKKVI